MYQPVYNEKAFRQILDLRPATKRALVLKRIGELADQPFTLGEFEVADQTGRKNQVLIIRDLAITFWADHPVKEVRVVDVRKLPR